MSSMKVSSILEAFRKKGQAFRQESTQGELQTQTRDVKKDNGLNHFLDASKEALLETERAFLTKTLSFLQVSFFIGASAQNHTGVHPHILT